MRMTSAGVASEIDIWQRREGSWVRRVPWYFVFVTLVFVYTTIANVYENGVWNRVEHYHAECYEAAGEPYGTAA